MSTQKRPAPCRYSGRRRNRARRCSDAVDQDDPHATTNVFAADEFPSMGVSEESSNCRVPTDANADADASAGTGASTTCRRSSARLRSQADRRTTARLPTKSPAGRGNSSKPAMLSMTKSLDGPGGIVRRVMSDAGALDATRSRRRSRLSARGTAARSTRKTSRRIEPVRSVAGSRAAVRKSRCSKQHDADAETVQSVALEVVPPAPEPEAA